MISIIIIYVHSRINKEYCKQWTKAYVAKTFIIFLLNICYQDQFVDGHIVAMSPYNSITRRRSMDDVGGSI